MEASSHPRAGLQAPRSHHHPSSAAAYGLDLSPALSHVEPAPYNFHHSGTANDDLLRGVYTPPLPIAPANLDLQDNDEPLLNSYLPTRMSFQLGLPANMRAGEMIHIGKEVGIAWECQAIIHSQSWPGKPHPPPCGRQFASLKELAIHFRQIHSDFTDYDPPFLFNCMSCGYLSEFYDLCAHCNSRVSQRWYYGLCPPDIMMTPELLGQVTFGNAPNFDSLFGSGRTS
jgi:hypothetical protein